MQGHLPSYHQELLALKQPIGDEFVLASDTLITKNLENFEIIKSNK